LASCAANRALPVMRKLRREIRFDVMTHRTVAQPLERP
jgi:hypothetical protein